MTSRGEECSNKYYREYGRDWYIRNKERIAEKRKVYYRSHKGRILEAARIKYHGRYRDSKLARIYGISKEEAKYWLSITICQICGVDNRPMNIDHDHATSKVRGRLCENCNKGLGSFKDNPDILIKAIRYLQETSKEKQTI